MTAHRWFRGGAPVLGALLILLGALPAQGQAMPGEISVHGLVSQGYLRSTDNNYLAGTEDGSFEFSEAMVNFSTQVSENLRVGLQLLARDLGKEGNNSVGLDWAYGDYRWRRNLGVRFGKLKSHIGLYNKGRDVDMLRTCILLPQSVYEETTRDFAHSYNGFSVYGTPLVPGVGRMNYEVYVGTLPVREPNSDFWRNNLRLVMGEHPWFLPAGITPLVTLESLAVRYIAGAVLTWHTPVPGLRLSGNAIRGDGHATARMEAMVPADTVQTGATLPMVENRVWREPLGIDVGINRLLTFSAEYSWRDLQLTSELLRSRFDLSMDLELPTATLSVPARMHWEGYYLMANYRFSELFEGGTYYAMFYPERTDKDGHHLVGMGYHDFEGWREDIAVSARFDLGDNWLLKLEAHRMDGAAQVMAHDNPGGLTRDWYLFLAKISSHF